MSSESKLKKLITSLKTKKHWEIVVAVVAVVVMLALYFSARAGKSTDSVAESAEPGYCKKTEQDLTAALEAMKGVGKVKVAIHWESGVEKIIAYATSTSGNTINTTPTIVQSGGTSAPVVLKEVYPKALGVVIICQGGTDVAVKMNVIQAVSSLLGISPNSVNVYAMK